MISNTKTLDKAKDDKIEKVDHKNVISKSNVTYGCSPSEENESTIYWAGTLNKCLEFISIHTERSQKDFLIYKKDNSSCIEAIMSYDHFSLVLKEITETEKDKKSSHSEKKKKIENLINNFVEKYKPGIFKIEKKAKSTNLLEKMYPEFHVMLLSAKLDYLQENLKKCPQLALYEEKGCMPPVISALHHSFSHPRSIEVLTLLSQYKANFNIQYQVSTHYGVKVDSALNPIAYLLINGGDYRLIKKLIDCGTNENHQSVGTVLKVIENNKQHSSLNTKNDMCNLHDRNPLQLADIFKMMKEANNKQGSSLKSVTDIHGPDNKNSLQLFDKAKMIKEANEIINQHGITRALEISIFRHELELINYLIKEKKADLEYRDPFSTYTFLMDSIVNFKNETDEKIIDCLLKNGANTNAGLADSDILVYGIPLDYGSTPLILLICNSMVTGGFTKKIQTIADLLLQYKADINALTKSKMTALHYAAKLNCPNWVKYLIEKGAALEAKNDQGLAPRHMAKNYEIWEILWDAKTAARREEDLLSPNSFAAQLTKVDSKDQKQTVLQPLTQHSSATTSSQNDQLDKDEFPIAPGGPASNGYYKSSPDEKLCKSKPPAGSKANLKKYEIKGDNHEIRYIRTDYELSTQDLTLLQSLLTFFPHANHGADRSTWEKTFLSLQFNQYPAYLTSIAANAYDSYGNTMLGVVAEYGKNVAVVEKLIELGADLDTPDDGMSKLPLHWAIANKLADIKKDDPTSYAVLECLLRNGANPFIISYDNMLPSKYAVTRRYPVAAKILMKYENKKYLIAMNIFTENKAKQKLSVVSNSILNFLNSNDKMKLCMLSKETYRKSIQEKSDLSKNKRSLHEDPTDKNKKSRL